MATKSACPNCKSGEKGRTIYRCKGCDFRGCLKGGIFSDAGCWTKTECPKCGERAGYEQIATITGIDSN